MDRHGVGSDHEEDRLRSLKGGQHVPEIVVQRSDLRITRMGVFSRG